MRRERQPGPGVRFRFQLEDHLRRQRRRVLRLVPANLTWWLSHTVKRSIGPDKINQLRHAQFLKDADGLREHMRKHAALIGPKFDAVDKILTAELGGLASWTKPAGGYFVR